MIALIDYGMGNIHSVAKAVEVCGAKVLVTNKREDILSAEKAILPGVGAFDDAMSELERQGLVEAILTHIRNKKPFLGICLGMQLLFEASQEGEKKGLSVISGEVVKFGDSLGQKVPHMGWNQIKTRSQKTEDGSQSKCPLLEGVADESYVYFCHSYYSKPKDKSVIAATTDYGIDFTSVVWKENVYGAQFHPEKSQKTGLKIIDNFVKLC